MEWTETWYPVAGLDGLRYANREAALNLATGKGQIRAAAAVTRHWSGSVVLLVDGKEHWREAVLLHPGQSFQKAVSLQEGHPQAAWLALRLEDSAGGVLAEYGRDFMLK